MICGEKQRENNNGDTVRLKYTGSCFYYDSTPYSYQVRDWTCILIFSINNNNSHNKAFFSFFSAALFSMLIVPSQATGEICLLLWCRIDLRCLIHFPFLLYLPLLFCFFYYFEV